MFDIIGKLKAKILVRIANGDFMLKVGVTENGVETWLMLLIGLQVLLSIITRNSSARVLPEYLWYRKGITWGLITSNAPSFRLLPSNATFDKGGSSIFIKNDTDFNYFIGLLNSKIFMKVSSLLNSTLNFQVKDIRSMPVIIKNKDDVDEIVNKVLMLSESDWDSFETSWDFKCHPLIPNIRGVWVQMK